MLRKIMTIVMAAGMAAAFSGPAFAAETSGEVHAQAVPLNESAGAAEVTAKDSGGAAKTTGVQAEPGKAPVTVPAEAKAAGAGAHVVIKGDTLWDLSGKFLDNPFMWTEIWKVNPQIENPNLIYPGQDVFIPGISQRAVAAAEKRAGAPSAAGAAEGKTGEEANASVYDQTFDKEEPFVKMGKTVMRLDRQEGPSVISLDVEKKEKIPVTTLQEVLNAGYLQKDPESYQWYRPHETVRLYYTVGDKILIKPQPDIHIGDYLITAQDEGEVEHPEESFTELGDVIQPTGIVRITGKGGDFYTADIETAFEEITPEDILIKFDTPETVYEPIPRNPRLKGKWGYVVSSKWRKIMNEQSQYLYLDLGVDDGVKVGDTFEVWREEPSEYEYHYKTVDGQRVQDVVTYKRPETYIGKVQVISVHDGTSTARATVTDEPIEVGNRVYYKD